MTTTRSTGLAGLLARDKESDPGSQDDIVKIETKLNQIKQLVKLQTEARNLPKSSLRDSLLAQIDKALSVQDRGAIPPDSPIAGDHSLSTEKVSSETLKGLELEILSLKEEIDAMDKLVEEMTASQSLLCKRKYCLFRSCSNDVK